MAASFKVLLFGRTIAEIGTCRLSGTDHHLVSLQQTLERGAVVRAVPFGAGRMQHSTDDTCRLYAFATAFTLRDVQCKTDLTRGDRTRLFAFDGVNRPAGAVRTLLGHTGVSRWPRFADIFQPLHAVDLNDARILRWLALVRLAACVNR